MDTGFDEQGNRVPIKDFDYSEIDGVLSEELENITPQQVEMACKMFRALLCWIWQDGMRNPNGLQIRTIIMLWIFLEELRPLSLTALSKRFGKHKQSFGRWVVQIKTAFPYLKTPHMKHTPQAKRRLTQRPN